MSARARIGISGWNYPSWRGDFYPAGLRHRDELRHAAERLDTIELNGSFYALQRPSSYRRWYDTVPADFRFAVKGGRYLTHMLRLRQPRQGLANFFASGVLALAEKLGPVLWQLPADLPYDRDLLEGFLSQLPRTTVEAALLASEHDDKVAGRALVDTDADRPVQHTLEVRHPSHADADCYALLRSYGIGLVVSDGAGRWPMLTEVTADLVHVRLHGHTELYHSGYSATSLRQWADRVSGWVSGATLPDGRGRDVWVHFDNDARGRAPHDAMELRLLLHAGAETS